MVLVRDRVRETGAWEDGEHPGTGFSKLAGTLCCSLLLFFVPVHYSRAALCSVWAQALSGAFPCCSPRAHVLLLSPWLLSKWLSSTWGSLRVSQCCSKQWLSLPWASGNVPHPWAVPVPCCGSAASILASLSGNAVGIHTQQVPALGVSGDESLQAGVALFCNSSWAPMGSRRAGGSCCSTEGLVTTSVV